MSDIVPSILSADFAKLSSEIEKIKDSNYIHLDVMDGQYVPNFTFGPVLIRSLRPYSDQIFDTHLMMLEPEKYIEEFANAGSDTITIHAEAVRHLDRVVHQVKETGCKVGIALNPATPLSVLDYVLDDLDQVLIMTVNPGYGGQKFISQMRNKIRSLRKIIDKRGLKTQIQIDGGVNLDNIKELKDIGVDLFVVGSAIFHSENPAEVL
ncbi:MAG: ribulose-phosphate 3-epimerase, partial [Halanaerobiales bacterium]